MTNWDITKRLNNEVTKFVYREIHQLKLMDSKCKLSAKPDAQIFATSCRIFLGPHTKTPTSDAFDSNKIPAIQLD